MQRCVFVCETSWIEKKVAVIKKEENPKGDQIPLWHQIYSNTIVETCAINQNLLVIWYFNTGESLDSIHYKFVMQRWLMNNNANYDQNKHEKGIEAK